MGFKANVSGTWRDGVPYTNVGGTWKLPDYVYNKHESVGFSNRFSQKLAIGGVTYDMVKEDDGNVLSFGQYGVYRFTENGDLDSGFYENIGTGTDSTGTVESGARQTDGKILVGGVFTSWNGTTVGRIVRLNADGTLDTAFMSNIGTGANFIVYAIAVQSDGKILVGGGFSDWNGTAVSYIVRLNSDGTLDTAFDTNIGAGPSFYVYSFEEQPDGKILVGGNFGLWGGSAAGRIVRLNSDGTLDTAFNTNTGMGANSIVFSTALQSDGKIVLGGFFTSFDGTTAGRIARLNSDGTLDTAFTTNNGTGANSTVKTVAVQSDGKIYASGEFTSWDGGSVGYVVRLNSDGTLDTTYMSNVVGTGASANVTSMLLYSDDKLFVAGIFTSWDGKIASRIARLYNNEWRTPFVKGGLVDRSLDDLDETGQFGTNANSSIYAVAVQSDGKILVGGTFISWNGTTAGRIARLNADDTLDTAFMSNIGTGANNTVERVAIQSDGKILVGGRFTSWNGTAVSYIVRLNSDGTLDTAFDTNIGTGPNNIVLSVAIQSDGKILVGGTFTSWNGTSAGNVARLNADGTLDTAFMSNIGTGGASGLIYAIAIQSDGKIIIGGFFSTWNGGSVGNIVRLNSNGTRETPFTVNTGTGSNSFIKSLALQSDGKILAVGLFTSWNGTSVGRIVRLNTDGTLDTAFMSNIGTGAGNTIEFVTLQPDGNILASGSFNSWNSTSAVRLVRLSSSGVLDTTFSSNIDTGADGTVFSAAVESDGKIVAVGAFDTWDNDVMGRIVRLNSDGSNTESLRNFADSTVVSIAIQSDGKILIGGWFGAVHGIAVGRFARLNVDCTLDTEFSSNTGSGAGFTVLSVVPQSDGKVLVGGQFTSWNGTTVGRIVRLNSNGTLDTAFNANIGTGASSTVSRVAVQSDGKILVGGAFTSWNGDTLPSYVVRLNTDGTLDTAFAPNTGATASKDIDTVAVQSDGKILVGGRFTSWNGTAAVRIARLNTDGTLDTAFNANIGTGANGDVDTVAVQSDGKILVGGAFTSWNGTAAVRIARLNTDGTLDTAFNANIGTGASSTVSRVAVQSDGKILVGGAFTSWNGTTVGRIVRLNSNGTLDTAFMSNIDAGADGSVYSMEIQSDGKILIGGLFTSLGDPSEFRRYFARIGGEIAA